VSPIQDSRNILQRKVRREWLALVFVLPIYVYPVVRYLSTEGAFSLKGMVIYSGVICALEIVAILLLQHFLIKERISALNFKSSQLWKDMLVGILLGIITLVLSFITRSVLARWVENETVNSMAGLFDGLMANPNLILLWLGPIMLIGVSQEELTRAFTLNRICRILPGPAGTWFAIVLSTLIFGFAHIFEGLTGVVWATIFGGIMAVYYSFYGRFLPLMIAHYFNNVFNFVAILALIQRGIIQL